MLFSLKLLYQLVNVHFLSLLSGAKARAMDAAMVFPTRGAATTGLGNQCAITHKPMRKVVCRSKRSRPMLSPSVSSGQCLRASSVDSEKCSMRGHSYSGAGSFFGELWLDLTGTAISQSDSAVQALHNAILLSIEGDNESPRRSSQFWDKVVVGEGGCITACSGSCTSPASRKVHPEATASIESTFHPEASVVGDILHFRNAGVVDPLMALETVVSGKWIMIDCSAGDSINNDPFPDRLECLVEFLSSAVSSSYPSIFPSCVDSLGQRPFGGVSIRCNDIGGLVHTFRVLSRKLASCHSQATESGLLVPNRFASFLSSDEKERDAPFFGVSISLPLDSHLWETALSFIKNV